MSLELTIKDIEEKLNILLPKNYDCLTPETGENCSDLVVEYIQKIDTVKNKSIVFIKRLTKAAQHILESTDKLDDYLEKIYNFHIEGFETKTGINELTSYRLNILKSHLLSHAGDIAKKLFEKTRDISWAEKGYNVYIKSSKIGEKIDPKSAAYSSGFAGDLTNAIAKEKEFFGGFSWTRKGYDAEVKSAELSEKIDPKHSAHSYSFAGRKAEKIFKKTKNKMWLARALNCYEKFLNYYKKNDISSDVKDTWNIITKSVYSLKQKAKSKKH